MLSEEAAEVLDVIGAVLAVEADVPELVDDEDDAVEVAGAGRKVPLLVLMNDLTYSTRCFLLDAGAGGKSQLAEPFDPLVPLTPFEWLLLASFDLSA